MLHFVFQCVDSFSKSQEEKNHIHLIIIFKCMSLIIIFQCLRFDGMCLAPQLGQSGWGHSCGVRFCSLHGHPVLASRWGLTKVTKREGRLCCIDKCVGVASNLKSTWCPLSMVGIVSVSESTTVQRSLQLNCFCFQINLKKAIIILLQKQFNSNLLIETHMIEIQTIQGCFILLPEHQYLCCGFCHPTYFSQR